MPVLPFSKNQHQPGTQDPHARRLRWELLLLAVVLAILYGLGYGVARWRGMLVMHEYRVKEEWLEVRRIGPGWDIRDDWRGRLKNGLNPIAFVCFRPLCLIEDRVRGSTRVLPGAPIERAAIAHARHAMAEREQLPDEALFFATPTEEGWTVTAWRVERTGIQVVPVGLLTITMDRDGKITGYLHGQ